MATDISLLWLRSCSATQINMLYTYVCSIRKCGSLAQASYGILRQFRNEWTRFPFWNPRLQISSRVHSLGPASRCCVPWSSTVSLKEALNWDQLNEPFTHMYQSHSGCRLLCIFKSREQCYDFKNILAEKFAFSPNCIVTLHSICIRKTPIFSPKSDENRRITPDQ
jgi:hypothetical protein